MARASKCYCGCGNEVTKGRKFKQGHDATFHSRVKKVARGAMKAKEATTGMHDRALKEFRSQVQEHKSAVTSA